jgi:hypothetical protein
MSYPLSDFHRPLSYHFRSRLDGGYKRQDHSIHVPTTSSRMRSIGMPQQQKQKQQEENGLDDSRSRTMRVEEFPTNLLVDPLPWSSSLLLDEHPYHVQEIDDGHIPERFLSSSRSTPPPKTRIVHYPLFHRHCNGGDGGGVDDDGSIPSTRSSSQPQPQQARQHVYVYPNALSDEGLVHQAYQKTVASHHSAWGEYVTLRQIQEYWNNNNNKIKTNRNSNNGNSPGDGAEEKGKPTSSLCSSPCELTIALAAEFLALTLGRHQQQHQHQSHLDDRSAPIHPGVGDDDHHEDSQKEEVSRGPTEEAPVLPSSSLWTWEELQEHQTHGVAVWALRSPVGSHVPYHLDYAEQVRYQSNVIVPPLVAGTLQCTPPTIHMVGGDFLLAPCSPPVPHPPKDDPTAAEESTVFHHYTTHGYKGKLAAPTDLVSIPFRFNQLTCHLGNVPHASSKVTDMILQGGNNEENNKDDKNKEDYDNNNKKEAAFRVIVGFNVFPDIIGPLVQQAPEHSEAFRKLVRQTRTHNGQSSSSSSSSLLSLQKVKDNKGLSKLLVLAKRLKIQEDFRLAQERLDVEIPKCLPTTVLELMNRFYSSTSTTPGGGPLRWPVSPTDVQVYLDHQIHKGKYKVLVGSTSTTDSASTKGIVSPDTVIGLADENADSNRCYQAT